jgi:hypothetical protein
MRPKIIIYYTLLILLFINCTILSRSDSLLKIAFTQLHAAGIDTNRVKGYVHYIPNLFIRDAGPKFLKVEVCCRCLVFPARAGQAVWKVL